MNRSSESPQGTRPARAVDLGDATPNIRLGSRQPQPTNSSSSTTSIADRRSRANSPAWTRAARSSSPTRLSRSLITAGRHAADQKKNGIVVSSALEHEAGCGDHSATYQLKSRRQQKLGEFISSIEFGSVVSTTTPYSMTAVKFGIAQFGTKRSQVQILSPRLESRTALRR
jgi:hypothetical protein